MGSRKSRMPVLIRDLYRVVAKLEAEFDRKFTPDGHLVGSIGEVLGAAHFGLTLLPHSSKGHDARSKCGRDVEIKATQGKHVALRSCPSHLVVLKLDPSGHHDVIYNGPGDLPWQACGAMGSNGQRRISLKKLETLMKRVKPQDQIDAA